MIKKPYDRPQGNGRIRVGLAAFVAGLALPGLVKFIAYYAATIGGALESAIQ